MALKPPIPQFTDTRTIHISGREFFYISNLLSMFRLLIVPLLFWYIYNEQYKHAVVVGTIAIISDILDGFFARLLNQHSELGIILDPIADKFAIGAGIIAIAFRTPDIPMWALFTVIFRDVAIVLGNVYLAYRAKMITRSNWWGKCTSFSLAIALILYLIRSMDFPLPHDLELYCLYFALCFVGISFVSYTRSMFRVLKSESIQENRIQ
ncbi:CDP-alcohol phosphatidyltransferase family protein [Candidatus Poribacteria bacterium]|nr:CDP-alcohol phosphatidyltransferase family protein [Candidatus Poribacteria bacterium]